MVRQGLIFADRPTSSPASTRESAALLQIRVDELARHGVKDIRVIGAQSNDYPSLTVRPGAHVKFQGNAPAVATGNQRANGNADLADAFYVLAGSRHLDINLSDLALALSEAAAGAVAVKVGITPAFCGVAILTPRALANVPEPTLNALPAHLEAAVKAGTITTRAYNRPELTGAAPPPPRGAVIFDRDGVLNVDVEYAHRPDQIIWIDGAKEAVKAVNDAGLFAFVATNQSGVARGYYTEADVLALHAWMNDELAEAGAHIDEFVHAPHHIDGVIPEYSAHSELRKPRPGMINKLLAKWPVDPRKTVVIGDKATDVQSAETAGVAGVLFNGANLIAVLSPIIAEL